MNPHPDYEVEELDQDSLVAEPAPRVIVKTLSDALRLRMTDSDVREFTAAIERGDLLSHHFTSGREVRNWMRGRPECEGWTDHEFDDNWMTLVYRALGYEPEGAWFTTEESKIRRGDVKMTGFVIRRRDPQPEG